MAEFSVIIASVNGLPTIAECLDAIEKRHAAFDVEIIVIDATDDETAKYITENFPRVKLIKLNERRGIPEMRAIGLREATGDYLIVTEDHCIAPENWFEEFSKAHGAGYKVVGGAVENGSPARLIDWAVFLCEYSSFMPPISNGETEFVAGNNVSYERTIIEQVDESIKNDFWEYFLQAEMRKKNVKFLSTTSIVVSHKKEFGFFYFLSQRFHYSRSFAAMRWKISTPLQKLSYLIYTPIAPLHLTWRIFKNVHKKKRNYREFFLSVPFLVLFMCSYAVGEFTGQLFGSGKSLVKVE